MPSGQDLTERLTAEARRALESYVAASDADFENLQTLVTSLLDRFRARARGLTQLEYAFENIVGDAMVQVQELAERPDRSAREGLDSIADFSAGIRGKETQEEILTHLLDGATRFATAVALLAVHGESVDGWAARGLPGHIGKTLSGCSLVRGDSVWVDQALEGTRAVENRDFSSEPRLGSILGQEAGGIWVALPLRVLNKPAAVLVARGAVDSPPDARALGLLIDLTALSLENIALRILREMQAGAAAEVPARSPVESAAAPAPEPAAMVDTLKTQDAEPATVPPSEAVAAAEEIPAPVVVESAAEAEEPGATKAQPAEAVAVPAQPEEFPAEAVETAAALAAPPTEPSESPVESLQPPQEMVEAAPVPEVAPVPAAAAVAPPAAEVEARVVQEEAEQPPVPAAEGSVGDLDRTLEMISQTLHSIEAEALRSESPASTAPPLVPTPEPPAPAPVPEPSPAAAPALEPPVPVPAPEPVGVAPVPQAEPPRPVLVSVMHPTSDEERLHTDAKRFARLLVTEIKLYNEQHVMEGRENRDIYVRLKRDIDRSRDMYEKRVAPVVSRKVDYFHDEIVRILGDNDPFSLGSDYPGSRAES